MGLHNRFHLMGLIAKGVIRSYKKAGTANETDDPIDFVVTWVDGNDPKWREDRNACLGIDAETVNGNGKGRYRDWNSFRYWFRAVEQYAPWVRYVHLVTYGHVPEWLNTLAPKLKIVKHTDFIPEQYLPTFNCNPIELNLFRIPGLSEHFVYFNDDMLLCRPVKPEEFFINGKPCHSAISTMYINQDNEIPYHLFFNTYGIINRRNDICKCIEAHPEKWFSHVYGRRILDNIRTWKYAGISGMHFTHMGVPFCRSTMEETWKKHERECIETCEYKLRDIRQITHQVFSCEDILNAHFEPSVCDWGICVRIEDHAQISAAYENRKTKMLCLFDRDNLTPAEVEQINADLTKTLERYLPEKSSFEL